MKLRHSVMPGLLGRTYDRFHEYQPSKSLAEVLTMAKNVQWHGRHRDRLSPELPA